MTKTLKVVSDFEPAGSQPEAINNLVSGLEDGLLHQTLLGVTGSGKTYTMAKVIEETQRPAIIMAHNKTLAAQLYGEFRDFFPNNSVEYFVSFESCKIDKRPSGSNSLFTIFFMVLISISFFHLDSKLKSLIGSRSFL